MEAEKREGELGRGERESWISWKQEWLQADFVIEKAEIKQRGGGDRKEIR